MNRSPLWGLVLAGGHSRRMGQDKGALDYTGRPQRQALVELLAPFCERVLVSCRPDQVVEPGLSVITDIVSGAGPLGGILSAFEAYPNHAWLVAACDMPLLKADTIAYLISQRQNQALATAFLNPQNGAPEPLLSLWEAEAIPLVRRAFDEGLRSPLQLLQQLGCHLVAPLDPHALGNANTPDERLQALSRLQACDSNKGNVS